MPRSPVAAPFASKATRWLLVVTVASLAASLYLLVSPGDAPSRGGSEADGYSRSALGHRGLISWLRELGEPVVQSRRPTGPGPCGLFVLAEPREPTALDAARLEAVLDGVDTTLLVLPKRTGKPDPEQPGWVEHVDVRAIDDVQDTFAAIAKAADVPVATVRRSDAVTNWLVPTGWPEPKLVAPAQLLAPRLDLEPIVACDEGVLFGTLDGMFVLADPDLIANHGLARGDNAAFVLAALRHARRDGRNGAIVFDETLHGHLVEPSVWHLAGRFPFVLVTAHVLLLLALCAWIARGRFGPPLPEASPIGAGKAFLIDNTAALLQRVGDPKVSLRRYARLRLRHAAETLRAPRGLDDEQCRAFVLGRLPSGPRDRLAALLGTIRGGADGADPATLARELRLLTEGPLHARS